MIQPFVLQAPLAPTTNQPNRIDRSAIPYHNLVRIENWCMYYLKSDFPGHVLFGFCPVVRAVFKNRRIVRVSLPVDTGQLFEKYVYTFTVEN